MSIVRGHVPIVDNFTIVPNAWLRDERLSWRARGVLSYLLSNREGWEESLRSLASKGTEGRDAVDTALHELESLGYLTRTQKTAKGHRFAGTDYIVTDPGEGQPPRPDEPDTAGPPGPGSPRPDHPDPDHPAAKKTVLPEDHPSEDHQAVPPADEPSPFDRFWAVYPRKAEKITARKAWGVARLDENADAVIAGAVRYRDDPNRVQQFTKHAASWLRGGCWDDDPLPPRADAPPPRPPSRPRRDQWRDR